MTSLMTSQDQKVGQILKLIYIRQYMSYSVEQKLKMSEMIMVIFLVYSTSGINSGKKSLSRAQNGGHFENFEKLNSASIWPHIWKDRPKLCQKKFFLWWWHHRAASKFLSIYMFRRGFKRSQWITLFQIASQMSTSQDYWVTFTLISNIANYLKYNYFWDCDGIDNVMLRLWKFSYFCSQHTVGVAGDDIMFHILVGITFTLCKTSQNDYFENSTLHIMEAYK